MIPLRRFLPPFVLFNVLAPFVVCPAARASQVEAAAKPAGPWKTYETRTLADLPSSVTAETDVRLDAYGGLVRRTAKATGFFRPEKIDGRWWLVDPAGGLFLHKAVVSVSQLRTPGAQAVAQAKFSGDAGWAAQTLALLRAHGFNGTGAWTDVERIRAAPPRVAYTCIWNFMSSYGKKRGGTFQQPGHTGYPKDCIFVFDPEFEVFCDEHAKQLAATKDDPWLLGHFTDNEMPLKREALANYLSLPESDPGHRAAAKFLRERRGATATATDLTEQDQQDFLGVVVDRYFRIVTRAIRKYDPNHLVLGSRFHGAALRFPEVFKAAGPHLDVVAVNYYSAWTPDPARLAMWERESGRPVMITEWYAKGMDSGMPNNSGAGWTVRTQADRGRFYENFTLGLLESKVCVGWHWFKYIDNDPADTKADPSNTDSNKGILSNRYEPYAPLLESMRRLNTRVYTLVDFFDARPANSAKENRATPTALVATGVKIETDLPYLAPERAEKLDLYVPPPPRDGKLSPAVVWIHGGGWTGGTKNENRAKTIGATLAQAGYVIVSIDYRLGPGAWPTNLHDCKNAVRYLRANAAKYGIDPERIAVAGGSAGGHLALMVGLTADRPEFEPSGAVTPYPGVSSRVGAIMNFYGVANLLTRQETEKDGTPIGKLKTGGAAKVFGAKSATDDIYRLVSPVTYVTKDSPPMLTLHGRADATVDYPQAEELDAVAKARGARHELVLLDGVGHTFDLTTWNRKPLPRDLRPVVLDFLAQHLAPARR